MEKTFREVIADIKEGQVWESGNKTIEYEYGRILVEDTAHSASNTFIFDDSTKYKLKRKEYTFEEAFKAYEEGKEIEDYLGCKYKKINNRDCYKTDIDEDYQTKSDEYDYWFGFNEIRGKWYIND